MRATLCMGSKPGIEGGPEFTLAAGTSSARNWNLNSTSSRRRAMKLGVQSPLRRSTFEATYRRISYAFAAPEEQSGGFRKACSGIPVRRATGERGCWPDVSLFFAHIAGQQVGAGFDKFLIRFAESAGEIAFDIKLRREFFLHVDGDNNFRFHKIRPGKIARIF
jgi:hypothetical protein